MAVGKKAAEAGALPPNAMSEATEMAGPSTLEKATSVTRQAVVSAVGACCIGGGKRNYSGGKCIGCLVIGANGNMQQHLRN